MIRRTIVACPRRVRTVYLRTVFPGLLRRQPRTVEPDGQAIFRFDTFGDEQLWTGVLRMHEAIATVDPKTALSVGLKVDADALPAGNSRRAESGRGGPDESGGDDRIDPAQRRGRRRRQGQQLRAAHQHRHHVRAMSFNRGRFAHAWHRQAPRRMGEHRFERRCDRRAIACAGRGAEGRAAHVGPRQIRSTAPRLRRHEHHYVEQPDRCQS